jgi:hypothetical protein
LFVKKFEDLVELGGTLGDDQDRVRAYAADMGINLTDSQTAAYARRIALGEGTIDTTEDDIRAQAIKLYPGLKKSLDSGVTVKDIADIYINQTARLLEINPERISLTDTKGPGKFVSQALNYMGQDGMPSQMPLYEFNRLLRSSEDWQKTENARDTYMDFGLKLAQKMGF